MTSFEIQALRGGEWLKVTSVPVETMIEPEQSRRRAIRRAIQTVTAWRASDQFIGIPLRIVEGVKGRFGAARAWQVITGVGQ